MSSPLSKKRNFFDLMEEDEKLAAEIDPVNQTNKRRAPEIDVVVKKEGSKPAAQIDLVDEEDTKCAAQIDLVDEEDHEKRAPKIDLVVKKEGKKEAAQIDLVDEEDTKCAAQIDLVAEEEKKCAAEETVQKNERVAIIEKHLRAMMVFMEDLMTGSIAYEKKSVGLVEDLWKEVKELKKALKKVIGGSSSAIEDDSGASGDDETVIEKIMDPKYKSWRINYGQLREYRIENGHCNVTFAAHRKLGRWVTNQRVLFREGKLKQERIDKLNRLSFSWGRNYPPAPSWNEMFQKLLAYYKRFGTFACSSRKPIGEVGKWAAYQRMEYKRYKKRGISLLTQDQIKRLDEISFNWNGPTM